MRRVFGVKKDKPPAVTVDDAAENINKRGDVLTEKIKKLDAELLVFKKQLASAKSPQAKLAIQNRAMRVLKLKKQYEGQRDNLYDQAFNLEQVAFATQGMKDSMQTMEAMKAANKELKGQYKHLKIEDVERMQDDMMDLMDYSTEVQEALGRSYSVPDDIDEDELLGELEALEADMDAEVEGSSVPSYLAPEPEVELPSAPIGVPAGPSGSGSIAVQQPQAADELGLPRVPQASVRT
ncbi:hypothetical protein CBR_g38017 [Chara braunii]|uniref:Charged multivesicular body protein 5 n=1 Tax=Chara braunii TaxID=69332 RepID=A0A388K011_CHABU|nr:hypothetical protein CBR_g38017 [Chara braunii]|eukprot:GBG63394.1 hypothetical protein CBR_g38017 [Chara braunii]